MAAREESGIESSSGCGELPSARTIEDDLIRPIQETTWRYRVVFSGLLLVTLLGGYCYYRQLRYGLGETGLEQPVTWGFYIVNFVFFIGISHAGTLISAILRMSQAEWRRPVTRMAEVITAIVLAIGAVHPIIDLGRPDRLLNVFYYGRLQSPLLWDVASITAYFAASTVYLYLPMIPDIALLRDRGVKPHWLYMFASWGWQNTPEQRRVLQRSIAILMVLVIPVAVSVHTVISFIFAMTLQIGWHSSIFGPYFVAGAIYSGIAALFLVMIVFRWTFRLQRYLRDIHFAQLSKLLVVMACVWFYLTFCEFLTALFSQDPQELKIGFFKLSGPYAIWFWGMIVVNFVLPVVVIGFLRFRRLPAIFLVSLGVVVGMWLERLIIVVPSLSRPSLPVPTHPYFPSLVEWGIFAGAVAVFCLGFMIFAKFFPIVSIWEIKEGLAEGPGEVRDRLKTYQPTA